MTADDVEQATRRWVERVVVGLNLCPFARPVLADLRVQVCLETDWEAQLQTVLEELSLLNQLDETQLPTTLVVFPSGLESFDDYLDLADAAETLVEELALDHLVQVATFHPDYCFEGEAQDDPSHYSNRSPYPMLHLIRAPMLSRILEHYPDPEDIPRRNQQRLRELGIAAIRQLME